MSNLNKDKPKVDGKVIPLSPVKKKHTTIPLVGVQQSGDNSVDINKPVAWVYGVQHFIGNKLEGTCLYSSQAKQNYALHELNKNVENANKNLKEGQLPYQDVYKGKNFPIY